MATSPLAVGSISLRLYPHDVSAQQIIQIMREQAVLAEQAGFDGVMTAEHHGGFAGYIPNPIQMAGWLLDATQRVWAAPCPLLLPLQHWSQLAEQIAWMACRFPGRVGAGFAAGGLAQDFEMAGLPFKENMQRFKLALPLITSALRGDAEPPYANDQAMVACRQAPVPMVSAAQSPPAVKRAARYQLGVLYDSLSTVERTREVNDAYVNAGGAGARIAIRRVWLGEPPTNNVAEQMSFYRSYAKQEAQSHWGGNELISADNGEALADQLVEFMRTTQCNALNLRVHVKGVAPQSIAEQISRFGQECLPILRDKLA